MKKGGFRRLSAFADYRPGFLACLDEMVDLCQESVGVDTVDHASLFYGLAAGGRAAQAVHADCHEQRSGLRRDVENVADDGGLFNFYSHDCGLLSVIIVVLYPKRTNNATGIFLWKKCVAGNVQRQMQCLEFVRVDALLPAFNFCQRAARQIAAEKLRLCRKLLLRELLLHPNRADACAD